MKLKTAAEKVVELCGERPLSLGKWFIDMSEACESLREALAEQPAPVAKPHEQEPVAYSYTSRITGAQGFSHHPMPRFIDSESWDIQPLYTSPPAQRIWVGLTDEEVHNMTILMGFDPKWVTEVGMVKSVVRNLEAKLKEKNT